ncbi:hypothetical protein [Kamptonema sp. UHCC 0994]|uniref:hypothetical protein n=1 Tax=Kamptonema sp. UHCC 0994 TaxID=3031329 RepID=UPI0023BADAAF|nr:hypothetical protein [Kamptonema sp. UHCC 0994]MDF0556541.1 hypothetical protein [Kamptonema sp. UHCC 0994]
MERISILNLIVWLAVLGTASVSVLAQGRVPLTNQQILQERSLYQVAQQPKSQLITWREFVERGGRRFVNYDYDLPPEFRNGYVYINPGADNTTAYILKQGLSSYPPIKSGIGEIDYAVADRYVNSGKAIRFYWGGGAVSSRLHGKDTEVRFLEQPGTGCLRLSCLVAPFMTNQQISRILHSERAIKQKN